MIATQSCWAGLTFRSVSIVALRLIRSIQGTPRRKMSVRIISPQRPSLQVGGQDVAGQDDPVAGAGEAIAQLDVLDGGPGIEPGVEAAEIEEDLAADHPAAGPEGVGRAGVVVKLALLVHEVVQQVAELADQAPGRRLVVVRAEEGGEAGIG